ncbi:hypothetical protein LCGC14_3060550 [marine sediment metagenome]|uniref:LamG-like jellyroll fold domain-containing protein n=1 Tax=marine sediment metagenome TaxID=412755 RepID=A0A0F8X7A2_9ZZZZ
MANTHSIDLEAGSSHYLEAADSASLDIIDDISIEAWIKLETLADGAVGGFMIVTKLNSGDSSYQLSLVEQPNDANNYNRLNFEFRNGANATTGQSNVNTFVPADAGTWFHVAVTADVSASTMIFYVDGVAKTTTYLAQDATDMANVAAPVRIGASHTPPQQFFDGKVDDVRIWADIRTASEIDDNKSTESPAGDNLKAHWKLNNDLLDSSGNLNTLTNPNSAPFVTDVPFVGASGPANLKSFNGLASVSIKSINGLAMASVKSINSLE